LDILTQARLDWGDKEITCTFLGMDLSENGFGTSSGLEIAFQIMPFPNVGTYEFSFSRLVVL